LARGTMDTPPFLFLAFVFFDFFSFVFNSFLFFLPNK
jgi:hypothetical protein